ncbi:hypothetical protein PpBr36_01836 [Pyricularia pennisetigena]|uniref:hypothetical protein n=1 Tax=Pyricularia pennisetigena TaxID=1578925 RepID=UPI00114D75AC|nr:hypothetical protein PpBr36_01836 [Pyricularia pennisetigena]TLS28077.1 hypothetical protein PpBr36_01836 [Pyricularia pennisetigena]
MMPADKPWMLFVLPHARGNTTTPNSYLAPPLKHCNQTEMGNLSYKILGRSLPPWASRYTKGPRPDNLETAKTSKRCFDNGGEPPRNDFTVPCFFLN